MRRQEGSSFSVASMAITMVTTAAVMQTVQMADVQPQVVKLPTPPSMTGVLRPNNWLAKAGRYAESKVIGPASMVVINRYVYTGLQNGWVVEIRPNGRVRRILRMSTKRCGTVSMDEKACGRPLGIRADINQFLVVVDAYKGIFRINPRNGAFRMLVDATMIVKDKPLGYISDLAVSRDGTIFFTSSSAKHNRTSSLNIILEGESTGRVLVYNPRDLPPNHVRELVSNLRYPSGLQLSRDESYLLIGEGTRAKIHRAWIGPKSPKRGTIETFAQNLPGFVSSIRLSPRNTYWVALSSSRSKTAPSLLDRFGAQPEMRRKLMGMAKNQVQARIPRHTLVVELDGNGNIIRSLHDPRGKLFSAVSEIEEERGILYLGSLDRKFVGVLNMRRLPPTAITAGGGITDPPGNTNTNTNNNQDDGPNPSSDQLDHFLNQVRSNTRSLTGSQLQDVVILLVRRLVEAVSEIRRVLAEASELRKDLSTLKTKIPANVTTESPTTTQETRFFETTTLPWFLTTWGGGGGQTADDTTTLSFFDMLTTAGPSFVLPPDDQTTTQWPAFTTTATDSPTTTAATAIATETSAPSTTQTGITGTGTTQAATNTSVGITPD